MASFPVSAREGICPRCRQHEYIAYRGNDPCAVCNDCLPERQELIDDLAKIAPFIEFLTKTKADLETRLKREFLWDGSSD